MVADLSVLCLSCLTVGAAGGAALRWRWKLPTIEQIPERAQEPPRLAGTFLLAGLLFGSSLLTAMGNPDLPAAIPLGLTAIFLVGLLDDLRPLGPWYKLLLQTVAALIPVLSLAMPASFLILGQRVESWPVAAGFAVLFLVATTNAFNLVDGVDGLANGLGLVAALGILLAALALGVSGVAVFAALLACCLLALFPMTKNPSRFFLGDSGSHLLGYTVGLLLILLLSREPRLDAAFSALFISVPVADTAFAIGRRLVRGVHPFRRDEGHIHHRLRKAGLSPGRVCLALCLLNAATVAVAVILLVL